MAWTLWIDSSSSWSIGMVSLLYYVLLWTRPWVGRVKWLMRSLKPRVADSYNPVEPPSQISPTKRWLWLKLRWPILRCKMFSTRLSLMGWKFPYSQSNLGLCLGWGNGKLNGSAFQFLSKAGVHLDQANTERKSFRPLSRFYLNNFPFPTVFLRS